jgi:diguanylate cyclase
MSLERQVLGGNAGETVALTEWQFRSAMESSTIGMAIVSLDGRWLYTNAAIRNLLGYDDAELRAATSSN